VASTWRQHQMAAARAARVGDDETYRRERSEAKAQRLAVEIRRVADGEPKLSFEQRARLAATLLESGGPS
jgi:hypothetical protein